MEKLKHRESSSSGRSSSSPASWSGASVFERVVLTPLWAGAPPASVMAWPYGTVQRQFFETVTPVWALLALATFVLSFAMPAQARPWARVAGVIGVAVMIWTVAFFIPPAR